MYAVLQTLTSSECTNPRSVHFIGGRNLLVGGSTQLVLWDILTHTGKCNVIGSSLFFSPDVDFQFHGTILPQTKSNQSTPILLAHLSPSLRSLTQKVPG